MSPESKTRDSITAGDKAGPLLGWGGVLAKRIDPGLLVILALPWALLAAGANWIFGAGQHFNNIDPWVYFGYFLDLPAHLRAFPETYYGSRLSWILPGYFVYRVFPPLIASYVLHVGLYYTAVVSFYLTLKHTVGRKTALFSAVLMGCYGYFLWAVGWNYVDGSGIAYFLLTILALTNAARHRKSWIWLIAGGIAYGSMIYANLFLVSFTPALLLFYVVANREQRRHSLLYSALFVSAGFLALSTLLGTMNYIFGGDLLFFMPSIRTARGFATQPNSWKLSFEEWRNQATWLVLPCLAFCSSLAFLLIARKSKNGSKISFLILFQLCFLTGATTLLLFQLKGSPVLQLSYYASYLIPTLFLSIGGQLAPAIERLSSRQFVVTLCGTLTILLSACGIPADSRFTVFLSSRAIWLVAGFALLAITMFFIRGLPRAAAILSFACLVLAVVNVASSYFRDKDPNFSKPGFLDIAESIQIIRGVEPSARILFWYQRAEPMGNWFRSVASAYLWGYSLINERYPSLAKASDSFQPMTIGEPVVILTNEPDAAQKAESEFEKYGFSAKLIAERRVEKAPVSWNMVFMRLQDLPSIDGIHLTGDDWPTSIQARIDNSRERDISLQGSAVHSLFQSDMNTAADWQINRYGSAGGLSIQSSCLADRDSCGLYASGDIRDHLASPFATLARSKETAIFFAVWVKTLAPSVPPKIILQNDRFETVSESEELQAGKDGWILRGAFLKVEDAKQVRLVVIEQENSSALLDKVLLLELPIQVSRPAAGTP